MIHSSHILPIVRCWLPLSCILVVSALLLAMVSCSYWGAPATSETGTEEGEVWFEDITEAAGLDFVHDPGPTDRYFMPLSMGSGAAFLREADGTLYLYLLQDAGPSSKSVNRLYHLQSDGRFQDVTASSGLGVPGYSMGAAIGDVNNDGLPDVLLTQYGGVKLFLNRGGGKFEDITAESGLHNPLWGMSAAFLDYDRDGRLDLVVVNYKDYDPSQDCVSADGRKDFCGPKAFPDVCSKLFHNRGPTAGARVRFEDVSFAAGLGRLPGPGLGVVCADFDGDGWPDIFVANDGAANRLWINQRDGSFKDEAMSRGVAYTAMGEAYAGMGVALGDVDNDGLLDLYVTHLGVETNTLWRQERLGQFRDVTVRAGLAASRWRATGFGAILADFDLNGALDLAIVNGDVRRSNRTQNTGLGFWEPYAARNQLLANDGNGSFRDVSASNPALCGYWNVARGLACADIDGDGSPDLLVAAIGARARLLHNVASRRGHWLKVRALDPALKRDAYGAEVRVRAEGREWLRLVNPAQSYLCSNDPLVHFGLGPATQIESILVTWPDGRRERFPGGPVDRTLELRKGEGRTP
ncbi:MAG TPA: CRTAC1 family protein [Gemmataceae bacterium]|nr:CRTAC1 family protein [Gemmataceae bacterium]